MRSRRHFIGLSLVALAASAARAVFIRADPPAPMASPESSEPSAQPAPTQPAAPGLAGQQVWIPLARLSPSPPAAATPRITSELNQELWIPLAQGNALPSDAPIVGPATGAAEQALAWLAPRAAGYTAYDISAIIGVYRSIGDSVGLDWFLALAQMAHETGSLTSWWSQRPRRNPAGIAVTGAMRDGLPDGTPGPAPGLSWAWDDDLKKWREGVSFPTWADDAVPAHLGRLLAYALDDQQTTPIQQELIARALSYRPLPSSYRGVAPTITGLNGRWAVPGTDYGQRIMALAQRMREA
jgi:hypothetical protein